MKASKKKTPDRRVERTQKLLRQALHSLIREKDYDEIVVKEILDRANVGRSAFYTHFRDKDELLVSSIHEILGPIPSANRKSTGRADTRILWFSLPIFEHLDLHRRTGELKLGPKGRAVLHGHLYNLLVRLITEEIGIHLPRRKSVGQIPPELLIQQVASTFILVLNWWVESKSSLSAKGVDDLFRSLILPALESISS